MTGYMVSTFNTNPFCEEAIFSLAELGGTRSGEDLDLYVRRFHEKALDSCEPVDEEVLLIFCLHDMVDEYCVLLENLSFPCFSRLTEALRQTNESVRRTSKPNFANRQFCKSPSPVMRPHPPPRKRPIVVAVEKGQGLRPPNQNKPAYKPKFKPKHKQEHKPFLVLPPFPSGVKKPLPC